MDKELIKAAGEFLRDYTPDVQIGEGPHKEFVNTLVELAREHAAGKQRIQYRNKIDDAAAVVARALALLIAHTIRHTNSFPTKEDAFAFAEAAVFAVIMSAEWDNEVPQGDIPEIIEVSALPQPDTDNLAPVPDIGDGWDVIPFRN